MNLPHYKRKSITQSRFPAYFLFFFLVFILSRTYAQSNWYEAESKHFKVIYRQNDSSLVPHLLASGENALNQLMGLFNYTPSEKIIINPYDAYDYGFSSASTVPENFIRMEIEPFEPGYENIPYNERFQWVLSHELVHVVVDDDASKAEQIFRSVFSKVQPEKTQPLSVFYSLLTSYNRYSPRWHQEGIAVFMETWLSGGFGRSLGNFDEMYFRTMVEDSADFPSYLSLDTKYSSKSFLLESLYYLYGTRFISYISIKYGAKALIKWYKSEPDDFYSGFRSKFEKIFGTSLSNAWDDFIIYEKNFQHINIEKLKSFPLTTLRYLNNEPLGWVTEPYFDNLQNEIYFGRHHPDKLAGIMKLSLSTKQTEEIGTLPTPSLIRVSSTAFDKKKGLFFYTTNNNQLFRDVWVLNVRTGGSKELFSDFRIGDLTVSPVTHELWGVRHSDGKMTLVYSPYPYTNIVPVVGFDLGDEIFDLSVSPNGKILAAVLHRASGQQSLILVELENLKNGGAFKYKTITAAGTPESPSWNPENNIIYWNAYTNGVSNVYGINLLTNQISALSNTVNGLFHPIYISSDSLFAFEFTEKGFLPVMIGNKPANHLPAINYLGQEVIKKNPQVLNWALKPANNLRYQLNSSNEKKYSSIGSLKILTFIPVITGFQSQKVVGFFSRISDPLIDNDITLEFGISPFTKNNADPHLHLRFKYDYKKRFQLAVDYNAPDFFDLFNERKRGMIGTKVSFANTHYWLYDNPHKIMQKTEVDFYSGVKSINDNLIKVSQPDFFTISTKLNSKNLRRSIGSVDYENGNEFNITLNTFTSNYKNPEVAGEAHIEWDNFSNWIIPHNIFHFKIGVGYNKENDKLLQAHYFFGGFGNRVVEDMEVKQYRDLFRFPGIPIYSLTTDQFAKILVENNLPPIRIGNLGLGQNYLNYIDMSLFSSALLTKTDRIQPWVDIGGQVNFVFKHWFNLESTFSVGIAKAWYEAGHSWEWFLSYKILKN